MHITDAITDYLEWHRYCNHSPYTIKLVRRDLTVFAQWLADHDRPTSITAITVADARAFVAQLQQRTTAYPDHPSRRPIDRPLAEATISGYVRRMKAFFRWIAQEGYLATNPLEKLKRPKVTPQQKEVLNPDEVGRLLAACDSNTFEGLRLAALLSLLFDTGLRISEAVGLNLDDVDMRGYTVRVRAVTSKSRRNRRAPFSFPTYTAMRKYMARRATQVDRDEQAVFVSKTGERWTRGAVDQAVKRLGKRVGIDRIHPHLLRHSYAVAYLQNGGNQFGLMRTLGHADIATTNIYVDYLDEHLREIHRAASPMERVTITPAKPPKRPTTATRRRTQRHTHNYE